MSSILISRTTLYKRLKLGIEQLNNGSWTFIGPDIYCNMFEWMENNFMPNDP